MRPTSIHPIRSLLKVILLASFLWMVLAGVHPAALVAACGSTTMVGNTTELNNAIVDFNNQTGPCAYEIAFENNITLTGNLEDVHNSDAGVSLLIDGSGFTLDAEEEFETFYIHDTQDVTIDKLTIARSDYVGIEAYWSNLRITQSTVRASGSDGLIFSEGNLVVADSTFSSNGDSALDIYSNGNPTTATIINSTLTHNSSTAVYVYNAEALFTHVTITGNGSGLEASSATVTVNNSILGDNENSDCYQYGGVIVFNSSLIGENDQFSPCTVADGVDGNIVGANPLLGPLGNYGGPTFTQPPVEFTGAVTASSPVIDSGNDALSVDETSATLSFDQRGPGFPRDNGTVDMGAFEGHIAINCPASSYPVSDEVELNQAILCFNALTSAVTYTIEFEADIDLTSDLRQISNPTTGISLVVDGAGFTLDAQDAYTSFVLNDTPDITISDITIIGSREEGIESEMVDLRISRSTIAGNDSQGIEFSDGQLVVTDSTLLNNQDNALYGYKDNEDTSVKVINSTITRNGLDGGYAVYLNQVTGLFTHVTVFDNFEGPYFDSSDMTINNSILAGNGADCYDFFSTVDINHSLVQDSATIEPCAVTDGVDGNIVGKAPFLGMLGDYGGATLTIPPLELTGGVTYISPVVDAGNDNLSDDEDGATLPFDQRGNGFPRDDGTVDMGAVEGTVEILCPGFPVTATNETELNTGIQCYGGITTPGSHNINLGDDIDLSTSTFGIENTTPGVSLVINGNGNTIDGQDILGVRPLTVLANTTVILNNAVITGGNVDNNGGGISNRGDMTLNNVTVVENTTDNDGGGIFNEDDATMAINDSTINSNIAIYPNGDGGGISNDGHMNITRSAVSDNTVIGDFSVWGGGIYNQGVMVIRRSTVANNSMDAEENGFGGGVANDANLIIIDSAITGNELIVDAWGAQGGGIYSEVNEFEVVEEGYGSQLTIINSTISSNEVNGNENIFGGGIFATDDCCAGEVVQVRLINTTVAANTVTGNNYFGGGGLYFDESSDGLEVTVHNSILADNVVNGAQGSDCSRDIDGAVFTSLKSLYEDEDEGACNLAAANPDGNGNIVGEDPMLGPLANNGGPTLTHLPGVLSEAIDAGENSLADDEDDNPLTADQRGYSPRDFNGTVDMGAVEVGATAPVSETAIYMSTNTAGTTTNGLMFGPEDVIAWDGNAWSLWFDGSAAYLQPFNAKHNLNAIWIPDPDGDDLVLSFGQNRRTIRDITHPVDGMDLVWWDGSNFSFYFDGSDVDLRSKTQEKIDALHILDGSLSPINGGNCLAYLLISTQGPGRVSNTGEPAIKFSGEDVLGFCATSLGEVTAGKWHMVLDGSAQSMPRNSTTSISVSDDSQTLYLTTRSTFNVDSATGGHSMIYAYDFGTEEFTGPLFIAANSGLPRHVDGLHVSGSLD